MANWDRTYNTPTVNKQPYTVTITCPAGWKAIGATPLVASQIGTKPNESYLIQYQHFAGSPAKSDVWKIGTCTYKSGSAVRNPELELFHTTPAPGSSVAKDKPGIRDGSGAGNRGSGTLVLEIPGSKHLTQLKVKFEDSVVSGFRGPIPEPKPQKRTVKKAAKKK